MRDWPQPLLWRLRPFLFLRRENLCFFLSERRLKGGVGVFPWGASGRQDGGFLRQNQHFPKPEEGGAGYGSFPHRKDRSLHGHVQLPPAGQRRGPGAGGARLSRPGARSQRERAAWRHRVHHFGAAEGVGTETCACTGKSNTGEANVGCLMNADMYSSLLCSGSHPLG